MKRLLQSLVVILVFGLVALPANGQPGNGVGGNEDCPNDNLLAKYELDETISEYTDPNVFFDYQQGEGDAEDIFTFSGLETKDSGNGTLEVLSGSWEANPDPGTTVLVTRVISKGGNDAKIVDFDTGVDEGSFSTDGLTVGQNNQPGLSNLKFCGKTYVCPPPTVSEVKDDESLTVTFYSGDPNEGITNVDFVNNDEEALNNYEVHKVPAGYSTPTSGTPGINYEYTGDGSAPEEATFVLKAVPPEGLKPGDTFTASYFAIITNTCNSILNADPVHQIGLPAPEVHSLNANYPNPFSEATTITFGLPKASEVTVSVYDITGRKVATLVNQSLASGTHQVQWNGRSSSGQALASGVYFYRIDAGTFQDVRRLTIVR